MARNGGNFGAGLKPPQVGSKLRRSSSRASSMACSGGNDVPGSILAWNWIASVSRFESARTASRFSCQASAMPFSSGLNPGKPKRDSGGK